MPYAICGQPPSLSPSRQGREAVFDVRPLISVIWPLCFTPYLRRSWYLRTALLWSFIFVENWCVESFLLTK